MALQKAKFERLSVHDEMTGLYNYRYLHTRLNEEFKRAERYHDPLACAFIDIDQLKTFNDSGTRVLGDHIIRSVAEVTRKCVRDVDVVARYGGDEFFVMLPATHFAGSLVVATRIWRDIAQRPFTTGSGEPAAVTASLGVALFPSRDVRTKDALLGALENALLEAKRRGGNRLCVFQQEGFIYTPSGEDRA